MLSSYNGNQCKGEQLKTKRCFFLIVQWFTVANILSHAALTEIVLHTSVIWPVNRHHPFIMNNNFIETKNIECLHFCSNEYVKGELKHFSNKLDQFF